MKKARTVQKKFTIGLSAARPIDIQLKRDKYLLSIGLVEDLSRNVSADKQTDLILLHFLKAFDKVSHSQLLWKLHQWGIRGTALSGIRAFLGKRSHRVSWRRRIRIGPRNLRVSPEFGNRTDHVSCLNQWPAVWAVITGISLADDTSVYLAVGHFIWNRNRTGQKNLKQYNNQDVASWWHCFYWQN